jgi:ATP-dependent Clp protease ATP-binding subunit ClpB
LIGYREGDDFYGGILTESVRERPFSLILLDELEKANPKVLDIFLQILDEGHVTDGIGREVNFSNTIIIATSNVGSNKISKMIEKGKSYKETYKKVLPLLRERYRVEFLNRFDKVIMFKPLMKSEIEQIADIAMKNLTNRLYEKGIVVDYKSDLLSQLAQKGYNPVYGARELKRVIQEEIEDKIAMMIVKNDIKPGKKLIIHDFNNFEVVD